MNGSIKDSWWFIKLNICQFSMASKVTRLQQQLCYMTTREADKIVLYVDSFLRKQ